jgi:GT2 family glycosyltransferase
MSIIASFIVPTHNRSGSVKKLLDLLASQTFPPQNLEVIIVANGCSDDTADVVRNYNAPFQLKLIERPPGSGPGPARNEGAAMAAGPLLIFADDDMELSPDFIKTHVEQHTNSNRVVIGYAPFKLEPKATLQRQILKEWWEEKFQKLREPGHRFSYEDLTSGNFSISSQLFKEVKGFSASFECRDDYELGYRLVQAGAEFSFAYEAMAFHNDKVTNLQRSLARKKIEAGADILFQRLHPEFRNGQAAHYLNSHSVLNSVFLHTIRLCPAVTDSLARFGFTIMRYLERLKMRSSWFTLSHFLHRYWYVRGLLQHFTSLKELRRFIISNEAPTEHRKLKIDLQQALKTIEGELDQVRPLELEVYYGAEQIGTVPFRPGAEPIRGTHLRKILKKEFSEELSAILYKEVVFNSKPTEIVQVGN